MTTANDVIEETQRLLLSGQREELNKLATSVSANATTLTFTYDLGGIQAGSLITIGLESYRVWSVETATKSATVQPAMEGTKSAAHTAGDLVYVNPKLSRAAVFKTINDELRALSAPSNGLFQMKTNSFLFGSALDYEVPDDVVDIHEVRMSLPGPSMDWVPVSDWSLKPLSDVSTFGGSNVLHLAGGYPGRTILVLYKAAFSPLVSATDDIATVAGMPIEMHDILPLGCLLRLGSVREIKRNFTEAQGDSRRSEEVPPSAVGNSFTAVRQMRAQRIQDESTRLSVKYPVKHR